MSILIKGMEMPQGNSTINVLIYADGTVYTGHVNDSRYSAVSVTTPHGRLIDADELANKTFYSKTSAPYITYKKFVDAPTVIEAEGETDA